jgi:NadR type nicotinamide-nucleotide adenylyltransferase
MENKPTIIALVGPESSGKTTLANQLALHFEAELVAEFAREYIDTLNRPYTKDDVTFIAKQQVESENRAIKSGNPIIICDTDVLVVKVWRVVKWGDTDSLVENRLKNQDERLYLLLRPDLPWETDLQREHPTERNELFTYYEDYLIQAKKRYAIVEGLGIQRFENALRAISVECQL